MTESTKPDNAAKEELHQLEELFKSRYTEEDTKYIDTLNEALIPPPCVQNWYSRPKRIYDFARGQGSRSQNRGQGERGNWKDNRDRREMNQDSDYHHRDRKDYEQRYKGSYNRGYDYGHRNDNSSERYHNRQTQRDVDNTSARVHYAGVTHSHHGDNWNRKT